MRQAVLWLLTVVSLVTSISIPPRDISHNIKATSWPPAPPAYPKTMEEAAQHSARAAAAASVQADPYQISIKEEQNWTRISFTSLLYKDIPALRSRYILANKLPAKCEGKANLPYSVFLPGYGAVPEDYGVGFPFISDLISNDTICCFYTFMPYFFIQPSGGFWYTNNQFTIPEYYLFIEVLAVIDHAMGDLVTKDPQMKILAGHSMGGFGAVMNAMRTNMQFFGSVCAMNGGLYIWNLDEFQTDIAEKVLDEAITRKAGPFINCSYDQPPYRYYADEINFNTLVSTSLAAVFHGDGTTSPKPNSPYFSSTLYNPDCKKYRQFFGFRYWLSELGDLDKTMFNVAPWNSPLGFLQSNYPSLRTEMSGNLFLSTTFNDTIVNFLENQRFSDELNSYNISHVFKLFHGSHYDVFEGITGCFETFQSKVCQATPAPPTVNPIPLWGFIAVASAAGFFLIVVLILTVVLCRRGNYSEL